MTQKPPPRLLRRKSGGFFVKHGARRRSFGTCPAEAHASYERFRIEWDQAGGRWPLDRAVAPSVSILVAEVWPWIEARTAAPSLSGWRSAARTLIEMNGPTDAECFGLPELEAIRQRLIDIGLGSSTVTQRVRQIKTLFRRGAAADINHDEIVNAADIGLLVAAWGDAPRNPMPPSDCPLGLIP